MQLCPDMENTEPAFLKAFDNALERIHEVQTESMFTAVKAKAAMLLPWQRLISDAGDVAICS